MRVAVTLDIFVRDPAELVKKAGERAVSQGIEPEDWAASVASQTMDESVAMALREIVGIYDENDSMPFGCEIHNVTVARTA